MDEKLEYLIRRYGEQAKSVWQFLFLLGAGWESVEQELAELIARDRADVPVLYAAVEQIAGEERAVTAEEAAEASTTLSLRAPLLTKLHGEGAEQVYDRASRLGTRVNLGRAW
jgi:hypothetical protein